MAPTHSAPRFPQGVRTWVCRICKIVGLGEPRCPICRTPVTTTLIYNVPPEEMQ